MRLNIDALQELYNTLTYGPVLSSPYAESPIDRAFKECDEKLSESATFKVIKDLENRCENLERSNKALRDDNDKVSDKAIELATKNEQLEKDIDAKDKENSTLVSANADLSDRNAKLQRNFDRINHLWTGQIQENMELKKLIGDTRKNVDGWRRRAEESEKRFGELLLKKYDQSFEDLKKDLDDAKKQLTYFTCSRDDWRSRAKAAEKRITELSQEKEKLEKDLDNFQEENDALSSRAHCAEDEAEDLKNKCSVREERIKELIDRLEKVSSDRKELQKDRDIWFRKNGEKLAEIAELKKQLDEVTSQYQKLTIENKRLQNNVRAGYDQGQTDLWVKLQDVKDMQPNEFDVECECLGDVIDMDLEDFLIAYKKWQKEKEQNETDRMRDWLADFCYERVCEGCPLESNEYKCGCGYSFKKTNESDTRIIPDEDIKRYYEKVRGCGRYTLKDAKLFATTVEGVNRAFSKACEGFCEAVRDADNKITENLRKGCTLEAKVEVNTDLLEKVCGVKPNEEEHKLDYGDAVRVPWKSYDYMYIGPEGKHIRLFDPKTHSVVVVSVTDNLTYQGCKIILCDEDDIRKIWKDKK